MKITQHMNPMIVTTLEVCAHWFALHHILTSTSLRAISARDWRSVQDSLRLWSSLSWTEAASSSWERSSSSSLFRAPTLICIKTKQKVSLENLSYVFVSNKTRRYFNSNARWTLWQEVTSPAPALCNGPLLSTFARPPGLQLTAQSAGRTSCQTKLFSLPPSKKGPGREKGLVNKEEELLTDVPELSHTIQTVSNGIPQRDSTIWLKPWS